MDERRKTVDEQDVTARRALAAAVLRAFLQAAQTAYEQARMDGLCHEGAWESAVGAMQRLDLETIVREAGDRGSGTGDWGSGRGD